MGERGSEQRLQEEVRAWTGGQGCPFCGTWPLGSPHAWDCPIEEGARTYVGDPHGADPMAKARALLCVVAAMVRTALRTMPPRTPTDSAVPEPERTGGEG